MQPLEISQMDFAGLIEREWLTTNGAGGYASSTLCGLNTRKYHGLLVAAMSPPARRMVLLSHVDETVVTAGGAFPLSSNEYPGAIAPEGYRMLRAFHIEPYPRWAYQDDGFTIEKSLQLIEGENTACLSYSLLAGDKPVELFVRPLLAMRAIHDLNYQWSGRVGAQIEAPGRVRIPATSRSPELFFGHDGEFQSDPYWYLNNIYRREQERGYGGLEDLWNPGLFRWQLKPGQTVHLVCSTDPIDLDRVCCDLKRALSDFDARCASSQSAGIDANLQMLTQAASVFVVHPSGAQLAPAAVQVISQYPWSPAGGRAALIAFSGLFLLPGKFEQGKRLLQSLAAQSRDGLIPTEFAEDTGTPRYTGADISLWYINAVGEYLEHSGDEESRASLLPVAQSIIDAYRRGIPPLGVVVDDDGLIASTAPQIPTSWMDAKVEDWIVTPRVGRTVELNALWYNALRVVADMNRAAGKSEQAAELNEMAHRMREAFNRRFWDEKLGCCVDVVRDDGVDTAVRPNQLLAVSLPHAVLDIERHDRLLSRVIEDLLTPFGVRTLSPRDSRYRGRYLGNVVERDGAQHQGSAYPWLLGALAHAYVRANGRGNATMAKVRGWFSPLLDYMRRDGLGQLPELFDGDEPHRAGGAPASAVSVGEILRAYAQDVLGMTPLAKRSDGSPAPAQSLTPTK